MAYSFQIKCQNLKFDFPDKNALVKLVTSTSTSEKTKMIIFEMTEIFSLYHFDSVFLDFFQQN